MTRRTTLRRGLRTCAGLGLTLASPRNPADRGSHVAFAHDQAHAVCQALIDRGVVGDFRAPDLVRFGFTPLYTRFTDVWTAAERLVEVVASGAYRRGVSGEGAGAGEVSVSRRP